MLALRVYDRPRPLARRVILPAVLWLPFGGAPPKALAVASYRFFARAVGDEKAPRPSTRRSGRWRRRSRRSAWGLPRLQGVREVARAALWPCRSPSREVEEARDAPRSS